MDQATNMKTEYAALVRQLLDAWHAGHGTTEQHVRLHAFRQIVHQEGRGAALDRLWVDPPIGGGVALREQFAAEVGCRLFGGPAAGPRPPVPPVSPQPVFGAA